MRVVVVMMLDECYKVESTWQREVQAKTRAADATSGYLCSVFSTLLPELSGFGCMANQ